MSTIVIQKEGDFKMKKKWLLLLIAVLAALVVLGAAACTGSAGREPKTQVIDIFLWEKKAVAEDTLADLLGEAGHDQLITEFYHWEPIVIVVPLGDTIVLNVSNPRGTVHGLAVPAFNVDTGALEPREGVATLEFVADKAGTFTIECSIPWDSSEDPELCHPDHKYMTGTLIVLDM